MEAGNTKYISGYCLIEDNRIVLNGTEIMHAPGLSFADFAKQVYRDAGILYPKFFKMDNLSKLAFLASEFTLKGHNGENEAPADTALVFANSSSSLDTDVKYQESINDKQHYYPSPAVFVYTLPNICLGEISIRHHLYTENSFFIFAAFNPDFFANYADILLNTNKAGHVLCGWTEFFKDKYRAFVYLVSDTGNIKHTTDTIKKLYNR
ncbi:3-oxoacyl-ACP synthase [Flavobacterium rhizosphaerae]|uniref:3-oxoacyl-ACP synthase n=1 Tax=Flavobacterium rhizosphaerae TaxID=3163298 RepID=A0ABW8YXE3_9FLAO